MKKHKLMLAAACLWGLLIAPMAQACTGVYVGSDLTNDGSTMFARTVDLEQYHNQRFKIFPRGQVKKGETVTNPATNNIFNYTAKRDSLQYMALPDELESQPHIGLYQSAGFNEKGLAIDATVTTYTNRKIQQVDPFLKDGLNETMITNYLLGQATSVEEAFELLDTSLKEQGASEGMGLMIADKDQAWYMEVLSGHQYVAMKMPKDKYAVFPNSLFIQDIDLDKPDQYSASKDLIKTAKQANSLVTDQEGRIQVASSYATEVSTDTISRYWAGVYQLDPEADNPLKENLNKEELIKHYRDIKTLPFLREMKTVNHKLTIKDLMAFQRNRFQGLDYTPSDNPKSFGADQDPEKAKKSLHPIGNSGTMQGHIFQLHSDMPQEIPGAMWLAMASPTTSPYLPFFAGMQETIPAYQVESARQFHPDSFYWNAHEIFNAMVADEVQMRQPIQDKIKDMEAKGIADYESMRQEIKKKYQEDPQAALQWLTETSNQYAQAVFEKVVQLRKDLLGENGE
ncbi:C69 family dipeptidase [Hutsoniella sourekii]|uniref:C69 family dipeptidase n=1 Tax=Hutsoniella sourekii TaxID=87650 RepID=UPI0004857D0C|nr:C69 family dipeptidase [Hutsoniella sourekii]